MRRFRPPAAIALLLLCASLSARAQTPTADMATIEGSVVDPDGKAIVNAAVVVRNLFTGDVRATSTDTTGHYLIDLLTVGKYDVEASAPGFSIERRAEVQISAGAPVAVPFQLKIGQLAEQITVSAALPAAAAAA